MNKKNNLKLRFYGGTESVTGANFILEDRNTKVLKQIKYFWSNRGMIKDDVSKGLVLDPFLFLLYINDIVDDIKCVSETFFSSSATIL